jgi:two-component system, LytTR family, response regulator
MKKIRTIVADDEPIARARLGRLLGQHADVELLEECRNGLEVVEAVRKHKPDLLFLDVQMPQLNGLDALETVARADQNERAPFVVFVTAHDQYALRAFDMNAVDYLLKPYDDERFEASLHKARRWMEMRMNSKLTGKLMDLMREHIHSQSEFVEVFTLRDKGREHRIPSDDVIYLRAEGNYVSLHVKDKHHLHRITMNSIETSLDPERFLRIHRSYIVNRSHIRNVRYGGNNEFIFSMANGQRIVSGRSYKEQIARALQEQSA